MRPYVTAAQLLALREGLSGRDFAVLGAVADARLLTGGQLQRLFFDGNEHASLASAARTCRRVLQRLTSDRLLVRLERRIGGVRAGSASYVYGLGAVGYRLLDRPGRRNAQFEPSGLYVSHTIAIAEIAVQTQIASRGPGMSLLQLQWEPACWRRITGTAREVHPDLFLAVEAAGLEYRWFVEVDLGTETLPHLLHKCRTFDAYYRTGAEQADHGVFPRVLWLMPNPQRAERLRRAIDQARGLRPQMFVVTDNDHALDVMRGGQP